MEQTVVISVLGGLILAGILWIARTTHENTKKLVLVQTLLMGGENNGGGLIARVNSLHDWRNEFQRRELELALAENRRLQDKLDQQESP